MDYAVARHNMVEGQIRPNGVTDPAVIEAMAAVPREIFAPRHLRAVAYADDDLEIGNGRILMEPMVLARLLQAAEIAPSDVALEIGTGSGYATAILSRMVSTVVSVESDVQSISGATSTLSALGIDNAAIVSSPLVSGYPTQGPYNVIFINGAVEIIPDALLDQIAPEGRLVAVVNESGQGTAVLYTRSGASVGRRRLFDANIPLLSRFRMPNRFRF